MRINPDKVPQIAAEWDPEPILQSIAQFETLGPRTDMMSSNLTQPTNAPMGGGDELGQILNPQGAGAAPLPNMMQMMQSFMPQRPGAMPQAPAAAPRQAPPMQMPMPKAPGNVPDLAQILGRK